jgi:hypothetical protein
MMTHNVLQKLLQQQRSFLDNGKISGLLHPSRNKKKTVPNYYKTTPKIPRKKTYHFLPVPQVSWTGKV